MEFAESMAAEYPDIKTTCGRLFAEVQHGDSFKSRSEAAFILCLLGYRRGFKTFQKMVTDYEAKHGDISSSEWPEGDEERFISELPLVFGMMNTAEAHAELVRIINSSDLIWLKCAALDGMAYEEDYYDYPFALEVLKEATHVHVKICAMWAFFFKLGPNPSRTKRRFIKKYILPQLADDSHTVRQYALMILAMEPSYEKTIRSLLNHPDPRTAEDARDALEQMEKWCY